MLLAILTVSSTAVIATITATPLRQTGPSDTPIFSVVSADPSPTSIRTVTATATVTMKNDNDSPFPAFNASDYPHSNFTRGYHRHHTRSCSSAFPTTYKSGNETFNVTIFPSGEWPKCEDGHHHGKNETSHLSKSQGGHTKNITLPIRPHQEPDGTLNVGTDGRVKESDASAENEPTSTEAPITENITTGAGASRNARLKRRGGDLGNSAVPKYVQQMEAATHRQSTQGETV